MESIRKDLECNLGILKKRFLFLKNIITHHFAEMIEAAFTNCCAIHDWLHEQDGWDDWEEKGLLTDDDVVVEYDVLDKNNRCYGARSVYHGFGGDFTRMEYRPGNIRAFDLDTDEDSDVVASEWESFENRQMHLINHYLTMINNHTLNVTL